MPIACKICIMTNGLNGSEISSLPETDDELIEHLEGVHRIVVRRENETPEQAIARFEATYGEGKKFSIQEAIAHEFSKRS